LYRDIDDLFEDDNDEDDAVGTQGGGKVDEKSPISAAKGANDQRTATSSDVEASTAVGAVNGARLDADAESGDVDDEDDVVEAELETIFESLCDKNKLVSKAVVREWDEVSKLLEDGLLGEDEFDELWKNTAKSPGTDDQLDVYGFLSFNVGLDGLFDFDDEEMDDDEVSDDTPAAAVDAAQPEPTPMVVVDGDGLSPSQIFRKLTDAARSTTLSREGLLRWRFLSEVLEDGDLKEDELDSIFQKSSNGKAVLDEAGFVALYRSIDDLFEENYEEDDDEEDEEFDEDDEALELLKLDLLVTLENLSDPELLPCGLECTEGEQKEVLDLVSELERQPTNRIRSRGGYVDVAELNGSWDLLYSSSSAMRFNKGLSGLGGSFPNGKFGGLKQVLKSTRFVSDVQYVERIEVTPSAASFDVTVTGDWELRQSVSLFTGEPSLVMTVQPDRVTYGVTNMKADHWKSLGPMNMLDVTYLDDDLRIMRGNTAVDTVFIFRRSPQ
jgi:PAP_fibrillin